MKRQKADYISILLHRTVALKIKPVLLNMTSTEERRGMMGSGPVWFHWQAAVVE